MSTRDDWFCRDARAEDDGPIPGDCPVCDGADGNPCSPECEILVERARIIGHVEQAVRALSFAREYVEDDRIDAILEQAAKSIGLAMSRRDVMKARDAALAAHLAEDFVREQARVAETEPAPAEEAAE